MPCNRRGSSGVEMAGRVFELFGRHQTLRDRRRTGPCHALFGLVALVGAAAAVVVLVVVEVVEV